MSHRTEASRARTRLVVLALLIGGGAALALLTPVGQYLGRDGIGQAIDWLRASRAAPVVYILVYATATALAIPGSLLTIAGGAVFGVVGGTLYTTVGANIGANLAFLVARWLGREGIEQLAGDRLDGLDRATRNHGFRALLVLRLIPAVPFNALNFGSGLTAMRLPTYAAATAIGIFPGTLVYTMFADALLAGSQEASREALIRVLLSGALLVALSLLPLLAKRFGVRLPGTTAGVATLLAIGAFSVGSQPLEAQALPSHSDFSALLADVVDQPRVDYARLKEERARLDGYLIELANVDRALLDAADEPERLAFWINAYNACMLRQVVDHYPIQRQGGLLSRLKNAVADRPANSVWQIPDVFDGAHCRVAGEEHSQDDIEHGIIRPMGDPRIHFAVNCAAASCPPLWPEAYTADALENQLERAVDYLTSRDEHFSAEAESEVRLNKVLDWYNEDFGGIDGLRAFLAPYLPGDAARKILDPAVEIRFFDYDWTLNDVARRP